MNYLNFYVRNLGTFLPKNLKKNYETIQINVSILVPKLHELFEFFYVQKSRFWPKNLKRKKKKLSKYLDFD